MKVTVWGKPPMVVIQDTNTVQPSFQKVGTMCKMHIKTECKDLQMTQNLILQRLDLKETEKVYCFFGIAQQFRVLFVVCFTS